MVIPRKSRTFVPTEPATLPEDQRTRAGRFLYRAKQTKGQVFGLTSKTLCMSVDCDIEKNNKNTFYGLAALSSLCVKRCVLVFKSKLLRQTHTTFHIHKRGYKTLKAKTSAFQA